MPEPKLRRSEERVGLSSTLADVQQPLRNQPFCMECRQPLSAPGCQPNSGIGKPYHHPHPASLEPIRGALGPDVEAAARLISPVLWKQPYVSGEGPMHYAGGGYWHKQLHREADRFERLAAAARVCAEVLPRG